MQKLQGNYSMLNHLLVLKKTVSDIQVMKVHYVDEDLGLILLCSLYSSFVNFTDILLYNHNTLMLDKVYEALHIKGKKQMVYPEGYAFNGEVMSVQGRT